MVDTLEQHSTDAKTNLNQSEIKKQKINTGKLQQAINKAVNGLIELQHQDGYWCFELEADCTIPAEYILVMHYLDKIDTALEKKIAKYIRSCQTKDGGWPLYYGGESEVSCSVKAYYALKLAGDSPAEPHMLKAKAAILRMGGAAKANVFARIMLAYFDQVPWRAVPFMPVEVMLFPRWFPFHISRVSYWSRTVMVPLLILSSFKPKAKNPTGTHIRELFITPPELEKEYFPTRSRLNKLFLGLDSFGRKLERFIPKIIRKRAIKKAEKWFVERLNGEDGLGGIFPAKYNSYKAMLSLGYEENHPYMQQAWEAMQRLIVEDEEKAYVQPCLSPVWDTGLSCLALQEANKGDSNSSVIKALDWLKSKQLLNAPGDWRDRKPGLEGGGWPFQFANDYYPDLDDTAVVAWAMDNTKDEKYHHSITRAANWLAGMQSKNGGFAAFDIDNTHYYLNEIPFADHGALLDPPTADVSARCYGLLAKLEREQDNEVIQKSLQYLLDEQEEDGSWYGRWGTNYIYGTWSVLWALEQAKVDSEEPHIRKAAAWLKRTQRKDGGWGEDNYSYFDPNIKGDTNVSTNFHTALAVLALLAAGEANSPEIAKGVEFLINHQQQDGFWDEAWYTSPGFPRVFYLKYHGYHKYFPLWALAKYRNLALEMQQD